MAFKKKLKSEKNLPENQNIIEHNCPLKCEIENSGRSLELGLNFVLCCHLFKIKTSILKKNLKY